MSGQAWQASVTTLCQWFDRFNTEYFHGELPRPAIELSRSRTRVGTMSCKRSRMLGRVRLSDFKIRVSTFYQLSERECMEVLLHEMIHYYIAYKGMRDTSSHGRAFCQMMHYINQKGGWHITVSAHMAGHELSDSTKKPRTRLVMALEMRDGRCLLAVVSPSYAKAIRDILLRDRNVAKMQWYLSADEYFATFPQVRTPRARVVERSLYAEKTAGMKPFSF